MNVAEMTVSDQQMVVKFVKQMYHMGNFDKADLTSWEQRATADKTYANAKTYIQEKHHEKLMYQKGTARNMVYIKNGGRNEGSVGRSTHVNGSSAASGP